MRVKKPCILIAIPFKDKSELVISCLNSIAQSYISGLTYEILLISDGSKNEEIDNVYTNNPYGKNIQIFVQENIGLTRTVYNIVNYSKERGFDFLLLSNNDIKFFTKTIHSLVKRGLSNPNIANVGCKVLDWNHDIIIHTGTRINKCCENWIDNPFVGLQKDNQITNNVERRLWNNGCCSLYNVRILEKENMNFDLDFSPAYFEESDLMTRLNIRGYSVVYEPEAVVRHKVNASVSDEPQKYGTAFHTNWELYLNKWKKYFNSNILYFQ